MSVTKGTGAPQATEGGAMRLWRAFAEAGPQVTAEALTTGEIERLHVVSPLDAFISEKVAAGWSVVLTGNAGDGKTHVLRRLRQGLAERGAVVMEDATAAMRGGSIVPVVEKWREAASAGRPFCLAANEYPLYQLRSAADQFAPLGEVDRQCRHRLAYGASEKGEAGREGVLVIDLSLRNPLVPGFADSLLDRIIEGVDAGSQSPGAGQATVARNASRLAHPHVRSQLRLLLGRLVSLGHRATVRELWILLARMVFGSGMGADSQRSDWYSEILFTVDARFDLTAALAHVDPAQCSHPQLDLLLETRAPPLRAGWLWGEPPLPPHPDLAPDVFSALKRAFFFEHERGGEALALWDPDADDFTRLLEGLGESGTATTNRLVDAINSAYCPVPFSGREHHLYAWTGHRFHEQPSRSFIASERVGVDDLTVEVPRLPSRIEGAFSYKPDHATLTARTLPGAPRLKLDFPLYRTLRRLGRGLPRKLVPERDIHRIDAFLERLGAARQTDRRTLWSVHLENHEVLQVNLSADKRRYEAVRING